MKMFKDSDKKEDKHDSPFYEKEATQNHKTEIKEPEHPEDLGGSGVPTAIFHGMGDACINPGIGQIDKIIKKGTGAEVHCIEVGLPSVGEVYNNFETIAKKSCKELAKHDAFKGEFNVVGLSQGALLARYIVEECEMPGKVRNLLSIGGPNMGVTSVPHCPDGIICDAINFVVRHLVYTSAAQNWLAPAGYFRDIYHLHNYERGSVFLPSLNNEGPKGAFHDARKERFTSLNSAMFVKFEQDTMVNPKESAWFQQYDKLGKEVLPLNATDFYNNDHIGLKQLTEEGKTHFYSVDGDHLRFSFDDIKNVFIPFLNQ